ncbi:MAG: PIG-L deacetylase family protein [Armatimonadota bacterium]
MDATTNSTADDRQDNDDFATVGVIVAHPDDETLWAGGAILMHPHWRCHIVTLCRAGDLDRAPRFAQAVRHLHATEAMADLDDGPAQQPLDQELVRQTILELLGDATFDLIFTHGPLGEYTFHRRHIETGQAVAALWMAGSLRARQLRLFAYEDGNRSYLPRPRENADIIVTLPPAVWQQKYHIIRGVYGFSAQSWEAQTTPRQEAFFCYTSPETLASNFYNGRKGDCESIGAI